MRRDASPEYRAAFDAAFSWPKVETERGKELRIDLEVIADALAGPMYQVLTFGNHDYVYTDREGRFPGVIDSASFRAWAIAIANRYRERVTEFEPETLEEKRDRDDFVKKAQRLLDVIDSAEAEVARSRAKLSTL